MAWTSNSAVVDVVVELLDGFRLHLTGRNAALLTYYGFLTLFPLFLAATTILGFVLESKPEWQDELIGSAVESVPFIGKELAANGAISGSWTALIIGLAAALWGSMKAFVGVQTAFDDTWEIPVPDRAGMPKQRLRALVGLAAIGGSQIANVALATIVSQAGLPLIGSVLAVGGVFVINAAVVGTMYRFLTSAETSWRMIWPGTVFTAALYTLLQVLGSYLTTEMLKSAETYGSFAGVLALLSWLSLHALISLFGAELNAALVRRREGRTAASHTELTTTEQTAIA